MKKNFGRNIKYFRYKLGYSQEKLAELLDTNVGYISQIELGNHNITFDRIIEIAHVLNVEPFQLFVENNNDIPARLSDFKKIENN